jgi:formylglycine-generating enzyme required for sulfatase activity
MAFCRWLSQKEGVKFTLPTEAQWEYTCRASSATPLFYGAVEADFSK